MVVGMEWFKKIKDEQLTLTWEDKQEADNRHTGINECQLRVIISYTLYDNLH